MRKTYRGTKPSYGGGDLNNDGHMFLGKFYGEIQVTGHPDRGEIVGLRGISMDAGGGGTPTHKEHIRRPTEVPPAGVGFCAVRHPGDQMGFQAG